MSQIYKNLLKELKSSEYSLDKNTINNYCVDWRGKYKGSSEIIFFPKSVSSVIKIVKFCYKKKYPDCSSRRKYKSCRGLSSEIK